MKINKRKVICFGTFFIFLIIASGNATAGSEKNSAIYEDRIVWQDDSNGNWDIQMYNISTSTKTQVTINGSDQQNPDISGNRIVWQDGRNRGSGYSWDPSGNWDIYMYDIFTQEETQITGNESSQIKPAIYSDKIVWQDDRNGNWDIYMYDISTSTETRITNNSSDQLSPDIYEDRIVWVEDGAIYLYNISTSMEIQITPHWWGWEGGSEDGDLNEVPFIYGDRIVCMAESSTGNYLIKMYDLSNSAEQIIGLIDDAYSPAIYDDKIVWENIPGGTPKTGEENHDIHMYNLSMSTEARITTNNSIQSDPAIYGDRIVWTDERNAVTYDDMSDIYMYDLSTSTETRITTVAEEQLAEGKETRITTDEGEQEYPVIYGDKIVWRDWRNGDEHDFINGDIYMYDISTSTETRITTNQSGQVNPDIYEDRIVWVDDRNGNWDIYIRNISTSQETPITTNESHQWDPVIYGNKIVWDDQRNGDSDIYMYDLSTHEETRITVGESWQYLPDIYGNRIVWVDDRNGNADIYMYDISTSTETQITTDESNQREPAIYGDRIVWIDERNGGWDIYLYNLSTAAETRITTRGEGEKDISAIYGDRIVWHENRKLNAGGGEIYMYNISTASETQVSTSGSAVYPAIYGDRIVWQDGRNGNAEIYMFTLASAEVLDNGSSELTPMDNIKALKEYVESICKCNVKTKTSLTTLLDNSMRQYEKGEDEKAISMLKLFIYHAEKMTVRKQISADEAEYLVREAKKIIDQIEAS